MVAVPRTRTGYALKVPGAFPNAVGATSGASGGAAAPLGNAKQDTLYWAVGPTIAELGTDKSQYLDNMAVAATWTYEASPATRFNMTRTWCFEFSVRASSTDTGRFFQYDCVTAASDLSLRISAGGVLEGILNNALQPSLTIPGINATARRIVISWSCEQNVDTTGAADAQRHELCAWNLDTGEFAKTVWTSVVRPGQVGDMVIWADAIGGTNPFTGTPLAVRIGSRFHSATETANDFVATGTAPATLVVNDHQGLPVLSSNKNASQNYFHGPAAAWVCDATRRLYRRTHSVLWNDLFRITTDFTQAQLDSLTDPWIRGAPNATGYRMHLTYFRGYPVPMTASHLWVRAHVRAWAASGAAVPTGFRFYSMNRPPGVGGLAGADGDVEPFDSYQATEIRTNADSASPGWWILQALVPIARGTMGPHDGWTYVALAVDVDPNNESTNDSNARVRIEAINVEPVYREASGVLGFGGDGGS
jgi:hypothetical protein